MARAFSPVQIGSWQLPQSFVMAPLTRNRAGAGNAPTQLNATYYAQRAGAGLIVTEGTAPSAVGQGYLNVPGLYTAEQVAGWRLVADAVHEQGGHIVAQLMHAGRIAHADNKDGEYKIVDECSLPYTGRGVVQRIITDLCVLDVTEDGLLLVELAPGVTEEDVRRQTEPPIRLP